MGTYDLDEAESLFAGYHSECNTASYYYWIGQLRDICLMEVCCGDEGAIFPGDYTPPNGHTYSGAVSVDAAVAESGAMEQSGNDSDGTNWIMMSSVIGGLA